MPPLMKVVYSQNPYEQQRMKFLGIRGHLIVLDMHERSRFSPDTVFMSVTQTIPPTLITMEDVGHDDSQ